MYTTATAIQPVFINISEANDWNGEEFLKTWEEWIKDRAETTQEGYKVTVRAFLSWLQSEGETHPDRDTINRYKQYLTEPHQSNRSGEIITFSADTAARYFRGVKMFFAYLEYNGFYKNITERVRSPKTTTREFKRDALERSDVLKVLNSIDRSTETGKRDYSVILACVSCGFRIIELQRANIEDLETISGETRLYIRGKGQTGKDYYKKIEPELYEAISDYLRARGTTDRHAPLFAACASNAKPGGGRLAIPSISRIIKTVLIEAGYNSKRITAHSLRHTSITLDRQAGATLEEASRHARHSNITVTQRYDHYLEKATAKDERRIIDFIFNGETVQAADATAAELMAKIPESKRSAALEMLKAMAN